MKDAGSFRAYRFALTPNQFIPARHIRSVVTGRVDGSYSFAFFASTAAGWPKLFFPIGARFSPLLITGCQRRENRGDVRTHGALP